MARARARACVEGRGGRYGRVSEGWGVGGSSLH